MIENPPTEYDDTDRLTARQMRHLERMLKRKIAENMAWAQYSRAKGDKPNGYARRGVIDNARILRSLWLNLDLPECTARVIDRSMFADEAPSKVDFDGQRTLEEIVTSLHETGRKPEVR